MELTPPDEDGYQMVINVRDFVAQHRELRSRLAESREDHTTDSTVITLRHFQIDMAEESLGMALAAFEGGRQENAWFLLSEAALAIGFLQGSVGAHLVGDKESSRARKANAAKGGTKKGSNARERLDAIALEVIASLPSEQIFDRRTLRKAFNNITADHDLKDVERKFQQLCKLELIKRVMSQPGRP